MFVGSFEPRDYNGFQSDVEKAINQFKTAKVTNLLIDLSNNGGKLFPISNFQYRYKRPFQVDMYVLVSSCTSIWPVRSLDMRTYQCVVEKCTKLNVQTVDFNRQCAVPRSLRGSSKRASKKVSMAVFLPIHLPIVNHHHQFPCCMP